MNEDRFAHADDDHYDDSSDSLDDSWHKNVPRTIIKSK